MSNAQPMSMSEREQHYAGMNRGRALSPKQLRRLRKKDAAHPEVSHQVS